MTITTVTDRLARPDLRVRPLEALSNQLLLLLLLLLKKIGNARPGEGD